MFYIDSIDEKTTLEWNAILNSKLEDIEPYSGWFDADRTTRKLSARVNSRMSPTSRMLLDLVLPFFQKAGLTVNPQNGYIEYESHQYHSKTISNNDEYYSANEVYTGVHECVIILERNERLKGGDLHIYNEDNPRDFLKLIGYEKARRLEYETVPGMVIVSNGDLLHEIQSCAGQGVFNYITVTLYEHARTGYAKDNDDD
jgi:hypothetical protein